MDGAMNTDKITNSLLRHLQWNVEMDLMPRTFEFATGCLQDSLFGSEPVMSDSNIKQITGRNSPVAQH